MVEQWKGEQDKPHVLLMFKLSGGSFLSIVYTDLFPVHEQTANETMIYLFQWFCDTFFYK